MTQDLWAAVMGSNPAVKTGPRRPVENVSWRDVAGPGGFLDRLNRRSDLVPRIDGADRFVFRLPSEAEWEYAARGGKLWADGFRFSGSDDLAEVGWYRDNSWDRMHEVGAKSPNQLGLFDMSGNTWEWCQDVFTPDVDALPADGAPHLGSGGERVLRGGCFHNWAIHCTVSKRYQIDEAYAMDASASGSRSGSPSRVHRMRRALAAATLLAALACSVPPTPALPPLAPAVLPSATEPCAGADADRDGLADACERALVRAFAPVLAVAPEQCLPSAGLPPGGWLHGAAPRDGGARLVYLPAYFMDCGWHGLKCVLPGVDCAPHAGDSEMIAIDVAPSGGAWRVTGVFLSAHCGERPEGDCRWYRDAELRAFSWVGTAAGSAPIVWVAEGRNANYPSRAACDRGHHRLDTCDRNRVLERFPVLEGRDVGSRAVPVGDPGAPAGCVSGARLDDRRARAGAVECFWSDRPFRGWQDRGAGVTPYERYLARVAEW